MEKGLPVKKILRWFSENLLVMIMWGVILGSMLVGGAAGVHRPRNCVVAVRRQWFRAVLLHGEC